MRLGWWLVVGCVASAVACAKAPGKGSGGGQGGPSPAPAVAVQPVLPDGELPAEPGLGARKPPPPMPGARAPLPPPGGADAGLPPGVVPGTPVPPAPPDEPGTTPTTPAVPLPPVPVPPVSGAPTPEDPGLEVPGLAETPPAAPPPDVRSAEPEVFPGGELTVKRFVLCKGVANREPVEPTSTFRREREGQIWVYLDAVSTAADERHVSVTFEAVDRPGAAAPPVDLRIAPGPRYRTWAWATAWRPAGRYRVVVRDSSGNVLARAPFEVVE
jgi:hypothetical protein